MTIEDFFGAHHEALEIHTPFNFKYANRCPYIIAALIGL